MSKKAAIGGGSSAVAASSHARCERFRGTDPLITGRTRRALAADLGFPDSSGKIPTARWMRAMVFERLVRDEAFASRTVTTIVGSLGLDRPKEVVVVDARINRDKTALLLQQAHERALSDGAATLIYQLALPFAGFEGESATDVKPDFAVVARKNDGAGSWLVMGDAKDYERHRSRIDDDRLLKGFLQVAVGAESAKEWSQLPEGMEVHRSGSLAVPRNAFLQPEALVEDLTDHLTEVKARIRERRDEVERIEFNPDQPIDPFVEHLRATYDPGTCPSCSLFAYCRNELRTSTDPADLLIEIGIPKELRPHVVGLVDGTGELGQASPSVVANVRATVEGVAQSTRQRRIDPIGLPGTVNLVLAKSDAGALAVHGVAVQVVTTTGSGDWKQHIYGEPQSPDTRRKIARAVGQALTQAMRDRRIADPENPDPVHIVVPDKMTADVMVSIADNLAGLELSRLRWEWDKQQGRPQLTYDGEPALVPPRLSEDDRTAVSFLLDEDRARAMSLRSPIVNAQQVVASHVVVGGPRVNALRLDYLVGWLVEGSAVDHRALSDEIETLENTPGARLTNAMSDQIHETIAGPVEKRDLARYEELVSAELSYKSAVMDAAVEVLEPMPASGLRPVHRAMESDAQRVWGRRLKLHASDLIRFGRTYRWWRNRLVDTIQADQRCRDQLLAIANPTVAKDLATDAGQRHLAFADVVTLNPVVLEVTGRRIGEASTVVLIDRNDDAAFESTAVELKIQAGGFNFKGVAIGPLTKTGLPDGTPARRFVWTVRNSPALAVGDRLVLADSEWFASTPYGTSVSISRPGPDSEGAPKQTCQAGDYDDAPGDHRYCCKSHELNEAEWSDVLADRRAKGELNPETWPPVRNEDAFEDAAAGLPQGNPFNEAPTGAPDGLTEDDLD